MAFLVKNCSGKSMLPWSDPGQSQAKCSRNEKMRMPAQLASSGHRSGCLLLLWVPLLMTLWQGQRWHRGRLLGMYVYALQRLSMLPVIIQACVTLFSKYLFSLVSNYMPRLTLKIYIADENMPARNT